MTYEQFVTEFWEHTKRLLIEPTMSLGELCGFLAFLAFKPPWWLSVPIVLAWLAWRNSRADRRPSPDPHTDNHP